MRHGLALLFLSAVTVLFAPGVSESACRAAGEYRLNSPTLVGSATFTETAVDESTLSSSGTVAMTLSSKQSCPVCQVGSGPPLTGQYQTGPEFRGGCILVLNVSEPGTGSET